MKKKKVLSAVLPLLAGAVIGFLGGILFIAYAETLPEIDRQPYYILLENNPEKAYKISLAFDKYTAKYPYRGEAEAEYELMRIASSAAN